MGQASASQRVCLWNCQVTSLANSPYVVCVAAWLVAMDKDYAIPWYMSNNAEHVADWEFPVVRFAFLPKNFPNLT
jgi:hypothetical protein